MRKMRVQAFCDDCNKRQNCFVKQSLEGIKIVECTNKNYVAPQESEEAGVARTVAGNNATSNPFLKGRVSLS
jgi:hypothetical protein